MRSRSDEVGAYFAAHAPRIERIVAARVAGSRATVEDACSYAWLQLVRRDDVALDERAAGWVYRVAVHEAWRLAALERATVTYAPGRDDHNQLHANTREPAAAHTAHDLVAISLKLAEVRALPERQRRALLLFAFGLSYAEIAQHMDVSLRTVDRLLRRATRTVRAGACEETPPPPQTVARLPASPASDNTTRSRRRHPTRG